MAITLKDASVQALTRYRGGDNFTVSAEQDLKIEISPQGAEIMSVTCPVGKVWVVSISINIAESDA